MTIYQIHEYGGEYEDRFDYIIASYLSKEKADKEMERLEINKKQNEKCRNCCVSENENCPRREPFNESVHEGERFDYDDDRCIHQYWSMYDSNYKIEEVDVIE